MADGFSARPNLWNLVKYLWPSFFTAAPPVLQLGNCISIRIELQTLHQLPYNTADTIILENPRRKDNAMLDREDLYKKCVEFHGHSCGGLLVGFRAALCAMERFGLDGRAQDEELVCVAENDACGVDAIQALLGCTAGKGNLIFRLRGKQAFTFYERKSGESFRISLKNLEFADRESKRAFMESAASEEIFDFGEATFPLPGEARIYSSQSCAACGERTAEPWLRVKGGRLLCIDCCYNDK